MIEASLRSVNEFQLEFEEARRFLLESGFLGIVKNISATLCHLPIIPPRDFDEQNPQGPYMGLIAPVITHKVGFLNRDRFSSIRKQRTFFISLPLGSKDVLMEVREAGALIGKDGQEHPASDYPVWVMELSRESEFSNLKRGLLEGIENLMPLDKNQHKNVMIALGLLPQPFKTI
ncbi:MAG: hypothetical protein HYT08_04585 [Candidatus Levybacteria bacterium]|nr:hypothetical protein [Candidatus Levybacteria bacterium]